MSLVTPVPDHATPAFRRQDVASTLRPQIACAKADGALGLGVSSRKIGDLATGRPVAVASPDTIAPRGVVPAAGIAGAGPKAQG